MFEFLINRAEYLYGADSDIVAAVRATDDYAAAYELVFPALVVHVDDDELVF